MDFALQGGGNLPPSLPMEPSNSWTGLTAVQTSAPCSPCRPLLRPRGSPPPACFWKKIFSPPGPVHGPQPSLALLAGGSPLATASIGVAAFPRNIEEVIFPKRQILDYVRKKSFAQQSLHVISPKIIHVSNLPNMVPRAVVWNGMLNCSFKG